jgi:hypothetical protein
MRIVACLLLLCGCHRSEFESSCAELNSYAPKGVTLASDEERCKQLLKFARTSEERYDMDFRTWLSTVAAQPVVMVSDTVFALNGRGGWTPTSFSAVPPEVPCGKGLPLTDALWNNSPLSKILTTRPRELYVSLSVDIPSDPGDVATIRAFQDFNCDHRIGVTEIVGQFHVGGLASVAGWRLMRTTVPQLDE